MTRRTAIFAGLAGFIPPMLPIPPGAPKREPEPPSPDARRCVLGGSDIEAWYISQGAWAEYAAIDCLYSKGFGGKLEPTGGAVLVRIA